MRNRLCGHLPPLLIALIAGLSAFATSFAPQEFPDSVQGTPVIIRGKIGMSYSDWGHDGDGIRRLYTYYEVQAPEGLKGEIAAPGVMIREMGGTKDGIGLEVAGTATFERGEDVVVFLQERNSEGNYDLQGMMMGKYNVATDSEGKEMLVGAGLQGENNPKHKKWSLEDLRELIHSQTNAPSNPKNKDNSTHEKARNPTATPEISPSPSPLTHESETAPSQNPFLIWLGGLSTLGGLGLLGFFLSRKK